MNLDDVLKEQSAAIERQKQAMAESARMEAFRHYMNEQIDALREIAEASKKATENAKMAAEASDKAAKQSKKIAVIATIATVFSALGSIISEVFAALEFFA